MYQYETVVKNPTGLHARPASQLTQLCKKFSDNITLVCGTNRVNPKSIISILSAGIKQGTAVTVEVDGENEEAVCKQVVSLIESLNE